MQELLAYSDPIQARGDILVLDEVLAVGDEAFQRKCDTFFATVKQDPTNTVILVTHLKRGGLPFYSEDIPVEGGKGTAKFSLPLDVFNPGQYKLVAYVRKLVDESDPDCRDSEFVGFTNDVRSCAFIIRNPELNSFALLTPSGLSLERLA